MTAIASASVDTIEQVCTIRAAVAPLNSEPRASASQVSQLLFGWRAGVVETQGDWLRVRGDDSYEGWLHRGYAEPPVRASRGDGALAPAPEELTSLGCRVRDAAGRTRQLPLGARLAGGTRVETGEALDAAARVRRFPRERQAIVTSALELFAGTPYEWGGLTPWGADCSGLVQSVCRLHGIAMPRDAWQQALVGADAGADIARLAPADLLFFSDREDARITHVAIAIGDGSIVHLALGRGGYAVDRLTADGDPYQVGLRQRFRSSRRLDV